MKTTMFGTMILMLCLAASLPPAQAATLSASQDAYVDDLHPTWQEGGLDPTNLYVLKPDGRDTRTLVQFDVSSIILPPGGSVSSAILKLQVNPGLNVIGYGQTVSAYRVTQQWVDWGVTWNDALYTVPWTWTTPGGDYDPAVHGDYVSPGGSIVYLTTLSLDITPIVQGWVDGTNPNYGVILKGTSGVSLAFYSMEAGSAPTLDITMVPEPFSLALLAFGGLLLFRRR